jgi:hypothetical protein
MAYQYGARRGPACLACAGILFGSTLTASAPAIAQVSLEALHTVKVPAEGASGVRIQELSGLSWDADEQLLYAVSDQGVLHHFRIRLDGTQITEIESVYSVALAREGSANNAEGITTLNDDNGKQSDSELLIAFEDGPSIARLTPEGEWVADVALPDPLADEERYSKKNSRLEAVAFDERHGMLTAPERPLEGEPEDRHTIYAEDGTTWSFEAFAPDSRLKAIQKLADGNLLILERTREAKGGPDTARLGYLDFAKCNAEGECELAALSSEPDAMLVDNFEGLARLSDDLFLIATDKTEKDLEPTTFVLFRVAAAE